MYLTQGHASEASSTFHCCNATLNADFLRVQSVFSIIILDDIERLLEYVAIGPRFSNSVLQTLLVLLKKQPPKGRKLLVLGTTSAGAVMEDMEVSTTFNVVLNVPKLKEPEIMTVLKALRAFASDEVRLHVINAHQCATFRICASIRICSFMRRGLVPFVCLNHDMQPLVTVYCMHLGGLAHAHWEHSVCMLSTCSLAE